MRTPTRGVSRPLVGALVVFLAILVLDLVSLKACASNSEPLYEIRRQLAKGQERGEVERILKGPVGGSLPQFVEDGEIYVQVDTGLMHSLTLRISFDRDRLSRAVIYTENGPEKPFDAPPNIE